MHDDHMEKVLDFLIAQDLSSRPPGYQVKVNVDDQLRVFVTRAFRPDWIYVNDRVGWVNRKPKQILVDAIKKKSKHLSDYKKQAGSDVRLLLVADCIYNSGKLVLEEGIKLDRQGFQVIYFYSRPQSVTVL